MAGLNRTELPDTTGKEISKMNFSVQVEQASNKQEEISDKLLEVAYEINSLIDQGLLLLERDKNQPWVQTYSEHKKDGESDEKIIQYIKNNHQEYGK